MKRTIRALWSSSPLVTRRAGRVGEGGASCGGEGRRSFGFVRVPSRVRRAGSLRNGLVRDNAEDPVRNQFRETAAAGLVEGEGGRREGGGRGGERATVNYPSATSPNWTRSGSGRRKRRKEKEDLFLSCVRTAWDDDDDDSTLSLWRRRGRATGRRIIFLWEILRVFLSWQFSVGNIVRRG